MKVIFKQGDIVKLSQSCLDNLSKELFFPQNLFEIKSINYKNEAVVFLKNITQPIPIEDIHPVKIDGREDRDIYYDPIVAAGFVSEDGPIPTIYRDSSEYYMDSLKKSYDENGVTYYDVIQNMGINYVHEIQNQIPHLQNDLKIHYHIRECVNKSNVLGRLGELEQIVTAKAFQKRITDSSSVEEKAFIYIKKEINEKNIVASLTDTENFDYVVICSQKDRANYYTFFINSVIGKLSLLSEFKSRRLKGKTNISQIKRLPIYYLEEYVSVCLVLQALMDLILLYGKYSESLRKDLFPTIFNFFSSIRDSMVLEMVLPKLFKKSDVSILNTWKEEVARLAVTIPDDSNGKKDLFEMISPLFEDLMSPGNELMENMNRLRLYMKEFMDFANKEMAEGQ